MTRIKADDDVYNDCVDAFTACNPFNPVPLHPQPDTEVYTCCHLCSSSSEFENICSEWDFLDYFDCHAGVVDDVGLGTLPQLWLVQMVLALEPVHEYFTSDGHLPLAVFDSSRNDDANDSDGFLANRWTLLLPILASDIHLFSHSYWFTDCLKLSLDVISCHTFSSMII